MFQVFNFNKNKGFIFLEILVAVALISIVFITLLGIVFLVLNTSTSLQKVAQADFLAREEIEAVRSFRDGTIWATDGLGSLVNYGSAYPRYFTLDTSFNPPKWKINSGTETVGIFTRSVVIDDVYRYSSNGNIVTYHQQKPRFFAHNIAYALETCAEEDPCPLDPNTKKITVNISYDGKNYQIVTYLTNWQKK